MFSVDKLTKSTLHDKGNVFDKAFDHLQKHSPPYNIIQIHAPDKIKNIFDNFLSNYYGNIFTMDPDVYTYVRHTKPFEKKEENRYTDFDALRMLRSIYGCINLFYFNSFDEDWGDSHPQALFNMHIMTSAAHLFIKGSMILLDDCMDTRTSLSSKWWRPMGKLYYVSLWLDRIGAIPIYKELNQQLWILP